MINVPHQGWGKASLNLQVSKGLEVANQLNTLSAALIVAAEITVLLSCLPHQLLPWTLLQNQKYCKFSEAVNPEKV